MKNEKELCQSVAEMVEQYFKIPKEMLEDNYWKNRLTSLEIGLTGVELVYLLFEIEKKYGVYIRRESLDNHGFDSIEGIAQAVLAASHVR